MPRFRTTITEPSLDDLLADDMMSHVLRSAGLDEEEFRTRLAELARRLPPRRAPAPARRPGVPALCC